MNLSGIEAPLYECILGDCVKNSTHICETSPSLSKPSRNGLLDVGHAEGLELLSLVETRGSFGQYVILSHR